MPLIKESCVTTKQTVWGENTMFRLQVAEANVENPGMPHAGPRETGASALSPVFSFSEMPPEKLKLMSDLRAFI